MQTAVYVLLLIVAGLAVLAVVSRTLRDWFAKPGDPPQRVVIVAPRGPSLWNRLSSQLAAGVFLALAAWLLMHTTAAGTGSTAGTPARPGGAPHVTAVPLPGVTFSGFPQGPGPAGGR